MKKENNSSPLTWHDQHYTRRTFGQKIADKVSNSMGSWTFIIIQTIIVMIWMLINILGFVFEWDPYPFILLNLLFSTQAAYAAPIIMMSQKRQSELDRLQALADYHTNLEAKKEIEELQVRLNIIETEKLDKILAILQSGKK